MHTQNAPQNLLDECRVVLKEPPPDKGVVDRETGAVCGILGLLVLVVMLWVWIATGTLPLYEWQG